MSSATPPGTPKPPAKWASRLGGAIRRSSTVLSIGRPSTPSSDPDSDSKSLRRSTSRSDIATAPSVVTPPPQVPSIPTPIAESPAREAAATLQQRDIVGPSPLVQQAATVEERPSAAGPDTTLTTSPEPVQPAAASAEEQITSPVGYVPPPIIDSTVGNPGAFTDVLEELPKPTEVLDPYAATNTGPPPEPLTSDAPPPPEPVTSDVPAPQEPAATAEYVPPPLIDSAAGNPGAYVEALPQPVAAHDPYADTTTADSAPANGHVTEAPPPVAPVLEQTPSYFDKPMVESILDFDPNEHAHPEFVEAVAENTTIVPVAVEAHEPEEPDYHHGEAASYYRDGPPMPVAEPHVEPAAEEHAPPPAQKTAQEIHAPAPAPVFGAAVMPSYDLPNYPGSGHDVWGGVAREEQPHDAWVPSVIPHDILPHDEREAQPVYVGTLPIPIPVPVNAEAAEASRHGNGSLTHSLASSFKMPNPHPEITEDPFADPLPPIIAIARSDEGQYDHPQASQQPLQMPGETHDDAHAAIVMPLPAFNEVIPPKSVQQVPSQSSFGGGRTNLDTDERIPLLHRPSTPNKQHHTHLQTTMGPTAHNYSSISPLASTSWNHHHGTSSHPRLHELGWLEYALPDGTVYYVHPTRRTVTDVSLRTERTLSAVEAWLDEKRDESLDVGVQSWLREVPGGKKASTGAKGARGAAGTKKGDSALCFERYWVDHHARTVIKEDEDVRRAVGYARGHIHGHGAHGKGKQAGTPIVKVEEDQLDMEYRFWSFMEAHPAHTSLPHNAKAEAMDVLTWAWTDRLLPSYRPIPSPFTQEECQELMTLLRSFGNDHHDDHGIQTRVVSRILLRVAHWRQIYFRPNKPLPKDVGTLPNQLPFQRRPFRRAIFDFLISCICLGIPYIFLSRARLSSRADEESGLLRGAGPMVIIGAATCLVAAIVLSASVTFLSLPGLDNIARTAGLVAVLFAAFAMAATGVAVLRHKSDMERPVSHVAGIERLMIVSRRTVAMSLPLVLLSYAVIGFVTAIVIYSFRGAPSSDPNSGKTSFEDYIKWTVVGVVGALAGILTTAMVVLRQ